LKNARHRKILDIIRENDVDTQEKLMALLAEQGYHVTQATISRDINYLRLVKIPSGTGTSRYAETGGEHTINSEKFFRLFADNVASVARGQNIVCVRCVTGMAQGVCAAFDKLAWENIVGTLAGEDTIFVLCRTDKDAQALTEEMEKLLGVSIR
jgi:transcriptional regulator of arginine metabolism